MSDIRYDNERSMVMEDLLYKKIPVLDHGFIVPIDYMGNDEAIVNAARVSYGKGTKKNRENKPLIRYLLRNQHSTPFEMCEIKLHLKMPIFVARQWIRHRTASVNECSARYSVMEKEFYVPSVKEIAPNSVDNKQGKSTTPVSQEYANKVREILIEDSQRNYSNYSNMLDPNKEEPISRELARLNLTLNYYTQMYWKIDVKNLLHFLKLRVDGHAQYEIRCYAQKILDLIALWLPSTYEAFNDYMLNAVNLSSTSVKILKDIINKGNYSPEDIKKLGKTEWNELRETFDIKENIEA